MYVVEVSNPFLANDSAYDRWTVSDLSEMAARLETGWSALECASVAAEVGEGESFEHQDPETGRTVTAWRKIAVTA